MIKFILQLIETLFPGYFALIMATGALSISSYFLGFDKVSTLLLYFNVGAYIVMLIMTILRLILYPKRVLRDLSSHAIGSGFFTAVAATCILGSQLILVANSYTFAVFLWSFALFLWFLIMYSFFTLVIVQRDTPALSEGINGAWLIAAVATQAVSILGTLLIPAAESGRETILFVTVCFYFLGCMLYLNIITLIFYRFTFLKLDSSAFTPPYWINMGAVAITTLAGATLIQHAKSWSFLTEITPFLKGFTLFFWAAGTWWIPLLFILAFWRHIIKRHPITYEAALWAMVFPLAMYTASTWELANVLETPFLRAVPRVMFFIAATAWCIVFTGFVHHLYLRTSAYYRSARREKRI